METFWRNVLIFCLLKLNPYPQKHSIIISLETKTLSIDRQLLCCARTSTYSVHLLKAVIHLGQNP